MCCESSRSQKQSSPKLLLLSLQEGTNYFKYSGPTDTNCGQTQSLPCGCKSVRSPSDGERADFYILVEISSQHRALSWWLIPAPPHLSRANALRFCQAAASQGMLQRKFQGATRVLHQREKTKQDIFFPPPHLHSWGISSGASFNVGGGRRQTLGVGCPFPWTCHL